MRYHYEVHAEHLTLSCEPGTGDAFTYRTACDQARWMAKEGGWGDVEVVKVITKTEVKATFKVRA